MKISAIIWDLGGVIVRTEDTGPREALAARFGLDREAIDQLVFGGEMGRPRSLESSLQMIYGPGWPMNYKLRRM